MSLEVEGREPVVMDLTKLESVQKQSFVIKEGIEYRLCIKFK